MALRACCSPARPGPVNYQTVLAITSALKRLICRVLIGMLLATQFSVAAYACVAFDAQPQAGQAEKGTAYGHAQQPLPEMPGLESAGKHGRMDPLAPNLCLEHCRFGQQKPDHTPAPALSPVLLTAVYELPSPEGPISPTAVATALRTPLTSDPPHSILHCCLRD